MAVVVYCNGSAVVAGGQTISAGQLWALGLFSEDWLPAASKKTKGTRPKETKDAAPVVAGGNGFGPIAVDDADAKAADSDDSGDSEDEDGRAEAKQPIFLPRFAAPAVLPVPDAKVGAFENKNEAKGAGREGARAVDPNDPRWELIRDLGWRPACDGAVKLPPPDKLRAAAPFLAEMAALFGDAMLSDDEKYQIVAMGVPTFAGALADVSLCQFFASQCHDLNLFDAASRV